jgi:hypothetical protein
VLVGGSVQVSEGGVCKQQLPGCEAPAQLFGQAGTAAEEGDLEAEQAAVR